jgi:O-antigen biosynthesis protein
MCGCIDGGWRLSIQSFDHREALAPIFRRSLFWSPEREALSAWVEHVPFAFWLVDVLRPRRIVELGTHNGVSYSAMCQAIKTLALATSCFAIDTWKGDEHAGFYGEEVYRDFAAFHDQRYGAFSQLVRSTFDDALRHFEDGSIDLLHIDGLHAYEAVRHDYESWLPKLAANAVVLFHDTNVRERDFGVFRLWSEISVGRPQFSFLHGHGLGALGHGENYPDALHMLFDTNEDCRLVSTIRETFATLGRSVRTLSETTHLARSLSERASEIGRLREMLAVRDDELAGLKQDRAQNGSEIERLREILVGQEEKFIGLEREFTQRTAEFEKLRTALSARDGELARLAETTAEVSSLRQALTTRERQIEEYLVRNAQLNRVLASHSWRMTRPLRFAGRLFRGEWSLVLGVLRSAFLDVARSIHRRWPLSLVHKQRLASLTYRVAGPLFKGVPSYEIWRAQRTRSFTGPTLPSWRVEPTAVMERGPRLSKANDSGWVLIADDFPPLHDQQSGGLRLKTLIDIIGEQGWPMVFASRFPRSGLPGVLSKEAGITRYQTALQEAGVKSFAYGLDEVDEMIAALGAKLRYAFLSRPHVAHDFIPCVRSHCPTATIIYDMVDFHALRIAREAELKHDANLLATAKEIKAIEVAAARAADITIAISNDEKSAVLDLVPTAVVDVFPNIFTMTIADPPGADKRTGLFFVGNFWHKPNVDAMTWFVKKIWPQIRGELPKCHFRIAGSYPSDQVLALARTPGVDVLGFVPDLGPLFDSARVFVAPLRYGAGAKGKVGQSLAYGLPVVTTAIGAEGMNLLDGEHALIADDPVAFASQVVRLLRDDALWTHLQARGRSLAQSAFSVEALREKVVDLFHV